jgi:hypothetical protein
LIHLGQYGAAAGAAGNVAAFDALLKIPDIHHILLKRAMKFA